MCAVCGNWLDEADRLRSDAEVSLGERLAGRWFKLLGLAAAAMIAVEVLSPLGVPGTDFANFLGYIV